jgi:hypothetical protein
MYVTGKCGIGGWNMQQSISKRNSFVTHTKEVGKIVHGLELIPQFKKSKSNRRPELENRVTALEEHLKELENMCKAQKAQIADLKGFLAESNKSIKDLENRNSGKKLALMALGTLFISIMVFVAYTYQVNDLFASYFAASETVLNAIPVNPLFNKLWVQLGYIAPSIL